jgi:DNA-binding response OmpR family regulator
MVEVVLVEDSSNESGLGCIAIALRRPGTRVHEARDLHEALALLESGSRPRLAILGWRALKEASAQLAKSGLPIVGFAARVTEADKRRALECGVRAIYDRPNDWRAYCDALEALLEEWLDVKQRA